MARVLIVGGGCRGRVLARELTGAGHAVRITTRTEAGRPEIERSGAECVVATPAALGPLRAALDAVAVVCWLLATATGSPGELAALQETQLEGWLLRVVDTTVRGIVYEAPAPATPVAEGASVDRARSSGARLARALCEANAIPLAVLDADPRDGAAWLTAAQGAVERLLAG